MHCTLTTCTDQKSAQCIPGRDNFRADLIPWPPAVGLVSRAAGRAVREQPASSAVRFGCTQLEWRRLQQLTRAARVVHSELGEYYADRAVAATLPERGRRLASRPAAPFLGSVGGYLSEEEQAAEFKRLAAAYPSWLAPPETVGRSRQGRPIWLLCASRDLLGCRQTAHYRGMRTPLAQYTHTRVPSPRDSLSVACRPSRQAGDERGGKPAVLYTALLHAREPASLACLLHFLRTLLHSAEEGDPGIRITHHTVQDDHEREDERGGAAQAPVVNNDARKSAEAVWGDQARPSLPPAAATPLHSPSREQVPPSCSLAASSSSSPASTPTGGRGTSAGCHHCHDYDEYCTGSSHRDV